MRTFLDLDKDEYCQHISAKQRHVLASSDNGRRSNEYNMLATSAYRPARQACSIKNGLEGGVGETTGADVVRTAVRRHLDIESTSSLRGETRLSTELLRAALGGFGRR